CLHLIESFRLTIWNVNQTKEAQERLNDLGFRLTIWNVNVLEKALKSYEN
ncbi:TPA: hypothetical protein P1J59_003266, partial [Clostridioides difficile]|nr:hypothetical protein [Clostridioides difficile]